LDELDWLERIPCLVQRFVPGHGAGIFALYGTSGPVAWFAHRRIREKPPSGGVSVLSESVRPGAVLQGDAERLLNTVGWWGPAMIEFRIASDGTPFLMEINGRLWGSLQLSIDAGIDFPALILRLARGEVLQQQPDYLIGRRLRWLLGDVDNLLLQLRDGLSATQKLSAVRNFLASFLDPCVRQEVFRWSDPRPAGIELARWIKDLSR
jgi:predicted ATP-grasp superfamily ATP-dependent carboligase